MKRRVPDTFCIQPARGIVLWLCMTLVAAAAGCGASSDGQIIFGKITLDGQPLPNGQIVFEPRGAGRMSVAQISDGGYQIPAGFGLVPGEYLVRITSERSTGQTYQPPAYSEDQLPVDAAVQFLPAKYNSASELTIDVTADAEPVHDFPLKM